MTREVPLRGCAVVLAQGRTKGPRVVTWPIPMPPGGGVGALDLLLRFPIWPLAMLEAPH